MRARRISIGEAAAFALLERPGRAGCECGLLLGSAIERRVPHVGPASASRWRPRAMLQALEAAALPGDIEYITFMVPARRATTKPKPAP